MARWTIRNTTSGRGLGDFEGDDELEAYRAMMAAAGYDDDAAARSAGFSLASIPAEIEIRPAIAKPGAEHRRLMGLVERGFSGAR